MFRSYSAYHIQMASLCTRGIITPALAPPCSLTALRAFEGINSCWVPTYYTWVERDKMPCLRAYASSGIWTHDLMITSQEHKPLHHSAPMYIHVCLFYPGAVWMRACWIQQDTDWGWHLAFSVIEVIFWIDAVESDLATCSSSALLWLSSTCT